MPTPLPPGVRVIVRDWLSANHVLLLSREGSVLIDTGYGRDVATTLALVRAALGDEPLAAIVNTHVHSDHIGGNERLAAYYGCSISVPAGDAAAVDAWDERALLLNYADQQAARFRHHTTLAAHDVRRWGELEWRAVAAPGHDMGALVFYNAEQRLLISGDALWEYGFGFVFPPEIDPACLPATRATLDVIAALDVRCVIPGHGEPFIDVAAALDRAYARLEAMERDSARTARSTLKSMLAFSLLAHGCMELAELPRYVEHVGIYRDLNRVLLHLAPAALAEMLVGELERAGVARREAGWLVPRSG